MINIKTIEQFWSSTAKKYLTWFSLWSKIRTGDFSDGKISWFIDAKLNVSVNCIDRHLPEKANQAAILWEGDNEESQSLTFAELKLEVCRMANVLKLLGLKKGDVVAIYLPMIPEAAIAMLACARIGAIHTVVFAGFSAEALAQRIKDSKAKLLITADGYQRGGKSYNLKALADEASVNLKTLVIQHAKLEIAFNKENNFWWHELKSQVESDCEPEIMDSEDPLFILYTSGSTGKPKGLVHTTGGYLTQVAYSFDYIFKCKDSEVFWCTADVGWITGHSYLIYGPLCNGVSTLIFAGTPNWPSPARCWKIIDKYKVAVFYTSPTLIRALKAQGVEWLNSSSRESLRLLGSVGEPINPEVWLWYFEEVGRSKVPIVDTWWQTETGAIMLCPQSFEHPKPGFACQPLPAIYPKLLGEDGQEIRGAGEGDLVFSFPWPSIARTIINDHKRYCETYFKDGYYLSGDGARRDADGDYCLTGRKDDVLNVSGHRIGTAEIESALLMHHAVAEAAVVGIAHELKGQGIQAYVSLKPGYRADSSLEEELRDLVKTNISAIAKPDKIIFVKDLPKTRSGKIMRRIIRQIAAKTVSSSSELGDLTTLANPETIDDLFRTP